MLLYALTLWAGAFLLFLLQPIIAKQILPWFGGTAAVWTTCLVFFQGLLFAGYAYADWTVRRLPARRQAALHGALLLASLACLPIIPDPGWKPAGPEDPGWRILGLLAATVGLPYFLLATTGPLVQAWFARSFPAATVYRLFALSNLASLLALLAYPLLIEPWWTTRLQSRAWSWGYGAFALLCGAAALYSLRAKPAPGAEEAAAAPSPGWREQAAWLLLAAMGTLMLLAVTNRLTQDLASVPFLWILPLAIYLLTFILCFEGRGWYRREAFIWLLLVTVVALAWTLNLGNLGAAVAIALNLIGLFVMCMFFHGELAARKPAPRHLTRFYLMVSLGGVLGGMAVALVAVRVFPANYEFGLGLMATLALAAWAVRRWALPASLAAVAAAGLGTFHVFEHMDYLGRDTRTMARDFYGTLRVKEVDADKPRHARLRLLHGATIHGEQYLAADRQGEPTTYYGPTSGVGRVLKGMGPGSRVGVIGLGTGTLAAYGRPGDVYRFYDIDPLVAAVASRDFRYLEASGARIEQVLGDARLALEREPPQGYDLLVVDAFASDSIPVHLITREAMAVYWRHMKPGGIVAFHVSNRYLRLAPVVRGIADDARLAAVLVQDDPVASGLFRSDWVLVARGRDALERPGIAGFTTPIERIPGLGVWTDDFNNLLRVLK